MEGVKVEKGSGPPPPTKKPNRYYRGSTAPLVTVVKAETFRGRNEGLKGHVFECTDGSQGDQFTVTMKEIAAYVGSNYSHGADMRWKVEHEALFVVTRPKKPDTTTTPMDEVDTMIFKKEVDEYVKRREKYSENCRTLFSLMLGQCSDYLKAKLSSLPIYSDIKESFDVLCLIKAIKQITYKLEESTYHLIALYDAKMRLSSLRQGKDVTNDKFLETFQTHVSVIEQFGGEISRDTTILIKELEIRGLSVKDATEAQIAESSNTGKGKYLAIALLRASDRSRYG
jgi:hypothetical protein